MSRSRLLGVSSLLVCAGALAAPDRAPAQSGPDDLAARIEALGSGDPERALPAWRALADAGEAGLEAALAGLAEDGLLGRRLRARLVRERGGAAQLPRVLQLLDDPDAEVRSTWIEFLARPDLADAARAARVAALARLAREDRSDAVRRAAILALGGLDDERSVAALFALARELSAPERTLAASSLPPTSRAREAVRALVAGGFDATRPGPRTPDDVLAAVLPLHGRMLADEARGSLSPRDGALLALGARHPSPAVRRATDDAFEALLARLRETGSGARALQLLVDLERYGIDARVLHYHRARLAFFPAGDPEAARASARRLRVSEPGRTEAGTDRALESLWLFRSLYLEGLAELGLGRPAEAHARLEEASAAMEAQLGERLDLADERSAARHVDALHQRALVEVALLLSDVVLGTAPDDPAVLERARAAHALSLEAQSVHARLRGDALSGWDALLDAELSPYRLLFAGLALPALDGARANELQVALGRALATVAPREMPGFVPFAVQSAALADVLLDPPRLAYLRTVQQGQLEGIVREMERIQSRVARIGTGVVPEGDLARLENLDLRRRLIQRDMLQGDRDGWEKLLDLRVPGSMALWMARDLRSEGDGPASREYASRMKRDLESRGIANAWYWLGQERLARADMAIGNAWTDADEPRRAEEALGLAVTRLEDIERRMTERGASQRVLAPYQALRSSALVSLAVNANVKLGEPERALEYYEEAYALRQDEFMRVLLACYRARSGRSEEARALLREIRPGPSTVYNMACTHALLGDTELALDYLERDLDENHSSEGSRRRQQAWAAQDPDLASLRGDPRFERLVGGK